MITKRIVILIGLLIMLLYVIILLYGCYIYYRSQWIIIKEDFISITPYGECRTTKYFKRKVDDSSKHFFFNKEGTEDMPYEESWHSDIKPEGGV